MSSGSYYMYVNPESAVTKTGLLQEKLCFVMVNSALLVLILYVHIDINKIEFQVLDQLS